MTVTVDRVLVEAANRAVAAGRASSISTWVNAALAERAEKDRYLRAMADALAPHEAEFGEISEQEMIAQQREDRRASFPVRAPRRKPVRRGARRAA